MCKSRNLRKKKYIYIYIYIYISSRMFIAQNRPRVSSIGISSAVDPMTVYIRENSKKQVGKKVGF